MVSAGTNVRSICDGVVIYSKPNSTTIWNRFTIIEHNNCGGYNTLFAYYGHIDSRVSTGTQVSQGQVIGTIGEWMTNQGDNSHLHLGLSTKWFSSGWGYQQNTGDWINPQSFF
jgi:murein DD-endopeptidase MepM/ murein hydrolase activator NlpD